VTDFVSKLADTVLWSSIGAAVLGLIIKLTAEPYNRHPLDITPPKDH
jgi:hypothetical protein